MYTYVHLGNVLKFYFFSISDIKLSGWVVGKEERREGWWELGGGGKRSNNSW